MQCPVVTDTLFTQDQPLLFQESETPYDFHCKRIQIPLYIHGFNIQPLPQRR